MPIRPVLTADYPGINALHRSVWWQERSLAGWRWLAENPAHEDIGAPAGLVAEDDDGQPIAFLGNFVQRFWQGEALYHGATGFSLIVSRAARGRSRSLVMGLVNQPGVFASYIFNANPKAAAIYQKMGMDPWPENTHALKLSWMVDPAACLGGWALRKLAAKAPKSLDFSREWLMNRRLGRPDRLRLTPAIVALSDFSDASPYADFWKALRSEGRLTVDRSPEIMRWRLADPDQTIAPLILAHRRGTTITGYAMAMMNKGNTIDPPFLEIIDLVALDDDGEAVPTLMQALIANARGLGAAKVRLQTLNARLLVRLGRFADRARHEGGWGHCFVAFREGGPDASCWAPTPFDGDYGVCGRVIPLNDHASPRGELTDLRTGIAPA